MLNNFIFTLTVYGVRYVHGTSFFNDTFFLFWTATSCIQPDITNKTSEHMNFYNRFIWIWKKWLILSISEHNIRCLRFFFVKFYDWYTMFVFILNGLIKKQKKNIKIHSLNEFHLKYVHGVHYPLSNKSVICYCLEA